MTAPRTAILLIGFQNDYFSADGALHDVVEAGVASTDVMESTLGLLDSAEHRESPAICLPILFSPDYHELQNPTGLMAQVRDLGAFRRDSHGGEVVPQLTALGDRIETLVGKTGFNAFNGTRLHARLQELGVEHVILCGVVTSVCIDSTGRAASELGYRVTIRADCIAGRSADEHAFYCENVFPLYASVDHGGRGDIDVAA